MVQPSLLHEEGRDEGGLDDAIEEVGVETAKSYSGPLEQLDRAVDHGQAMHPQGLSPLQKILVQRLLLYLRFRLVQVHEYQYCKEH